MKFVTVTLAVLFFSISISPCEDGEAELSFSNEINIQIENQMSGVAATDFCSPFCFCHCCHIHIIQVKTTPTKIVNFLIEKSLKTGTKTPIGFSSSPWQPPQV